MHRAAPRHTPSEPSQERPHLASSDSREGYVNGAHGAANGWNKEPGLLAAKLSKEYARVPGPRAPQLIVA